MIIERLLCHFKQWENTAFHIFLRQWTNEQAGASTDTNNETASCTINQRFALGYLTTRDPSVSLTHIRRPDRDFWMRWVVHARWDSRRLLSMELLVFFCFYFSFFSFLLLLLLVVIFRFFFLFLSFFFFFFLFFIFFFISLLFYFLFTCFFFFFFFFLFSFFFFFFFFLLLLLLLLLLLFLLFLLFPLFFSSLISFLGPSPLRPVRQDLKTFKQGVVMNLILIKQVVGQWMILCFFSILAHSWQDCDRVGLLVVHRKLYDIRLKTMWLPKTIWLPVT